jgi:hypothetical protein
MSWDQIVFRDAIGCWARAPRLSRWLLVPVAGPHLDSPGRHYLNHKLLPKQMTPIAFAE